MCIECQVKKDMEIWLFSLSPVGTHLTATLRIIIDPNKGPVKRPAHTTHKCAVIGWQREITVG